MKTTINPVEEASRAGAWSSSWHRVGDGRWSGVVTARNGSEFDIDEVADGWRSIVDDRPVKDRSLEALVRKLVDG